jgi:translation initiation factor IF-3
LRENKNVRGNQPIRASKIRLIDENGEMLGIVSLKDALDLAAQKNLDLIEISPEADPPVCKIADYGRMRYKDQKKKTEMRRKQKVIVVKEIQFRPRIDEHDYQVKLNQTREFLNKGNKVRASVQFRGREVTFIQLGEKLMERFLLDVSEQGKAEFPPKLEGKKFWLPLLL